MNSGKKLFLIISIVTIFLFQETKLFADNHDIMEKLDLIQKDLKTLEKAVYSESANFSGENLPGIKINKDMMNKNIVELVVSVIKNISKSEIRRLIKSNGIKIDNKTINDEKIIINNQLFKGKKFIKLSLGKKKHFKIVI